MRISDWSSDVCSSDLDDREFIDEGRPWADAGKADPGHAVELRRDQQPMPVDRAVLVEIVRYRQADGRSLLQPDERCRDSAVHADGMACPTVDGHHLVGDPPRDVEIGRASGRERLCEYV